MLTARAPATFKIGDALGEASKLAYNVELSSLQNRQLLAWFFQYGFFSNISQLLFCQHPGHSHGHEIVFEIRLLIDIAIICFHMDLLFDYD